MGHRGRQWAVAAVLTVTAAGVPVLPAAPAASAAARICTSSSPARARLAARLSRQIRAVSRRRRSFAAVAVADPSLGITCSLYASRHFYAASTVKVTILAALLRKAAEQHRHLTRAERRSAWLMITRSDNSAASALWDDTGRRWLRHFLRLAMMRRTVLGPGGYWGLTRITAHDESLLLGLLAGDNRVLSRPDRRYERGLMGRVVPWQRWGTPAGASASYRVHVKNGWLPVRGYGWIINSLGVFTRPGGRSYTMAVLTDHNPGMGYGITTVEDIAGVINRRLAEAAGASPATVPRSVPSARWGRPDETIPPRLRPGPAGESKP